MKENEFNSKDIPSVNKMLTVLKYLNQGRIVKLGDYAVKIAETIGGGIKFMTALDSETWVGVDSIEWFSTLCDKTSEREITIMQANMALTEAFKTNRNGSR